MSVAGLKLNPLEKPDLSLPALQSKFSLLSGNKSRNTPRVNFNPFLDAEGNLINKHLNYQQMLNNPSIDSKVKQFIADATGLELPGSKIRSTARVRPKAATKTDENGVPLKASLRESYDSGSGTVTPTPASGTSGAKVSPTGNAVADAAQKYIGTPYVWGGESMSEGGMDCSGFVYNALNDAGVKVGRTTAQGYRNGGTPVSKSELQPGDLVYYGKGSEATHVGVYLGNGKIAHSAGGSKNTASNPGKGVTIADLNHRSDYLGANRY